MIRITTFAGKTVAVFGLGASGNATAAALLAGGASVAAWDDSETGRAAAGAAGVPLVDLNSADWTQFAALVLTPGVPLTHPQPHWTVERARAAGIEVIGDVELFCRQRALTCPDAPFIAITGTNGKSTTTALIAHIFKSAGLDAQMGGNIGRAILTLEPPSHSRTHVIELSSFQIDLTPSLKPSVGVLLNVTPDHLDRHGTLENYAAVKERLVAASDAAVVGMDDEICAAIAQRLEAGGKIVRRVRTGLPGIHEYGMDDEFVCFDTRFDGRVRVVSLHGIASLRGQHNAQNAVAAFAATWDHVRPSVYPEAYTTFPGLPHRMEEIGRVGRVLYINDSKATNADSTEKALLSFPRDVFWIVGGTAKDGGIEPLRNYFSRIVRAYLIGASSDEFGQSLDGDAAIIPCGTLDVAVSRAAADAAAYAMGEAMPLYNVEGKIGIGTLVPWSGPHPQSSTAAQPVVLLSPACASYDQYKNFEQRGDHFRKLVAALPGVALRRPQ
jgi:UDP-N-acetylmuramoylalanine--D-glutamate ligase